MYETEEASQFEVGSDSEELRLARVFIFVIIMHMKKLTPDQIKDQLRKERKQQINPYKDEVDLTVDHLVDLYEQKKIDEVTLRTFISFTLASTMNDTVSGLRNDLIKKGFLNIRNSEPNKLLLINYSKENYA